MRLVACIYIIIITPALTLRGAPRPCRTVRSWSCSSLRSDGKPPSCPNHPAGSLSFPSPLGICDVSVGAAAAAAAACFFSRILSLSADSDSFFGFVSGVVDGPPGVGLVARGDVGWVDSGDASAAEGDAATPEHLGTEEPPRPASAD